VEVVVDYFKTPPRNLSGVVEKTHKRIRIRIFGVATEIRTGHFLNISQKRYHLRQIALLFNHQMADYAYNRVDTKVYTAHIKPAFHS
jgi:hypothetical protein